jgi:cardiolipin synthase A/B
MGIDLNLLKAEALMSSSSSEIREIVFSQADEYFSALLQDIAQASSSINLETYIFDFDSLGKQVAEHLTAASRRGVTVRLMVDGVGSSSWDSRMTQQLEQAGIQVRIFRPLPWKISQWKWVRPHLSVMAKLQHLWGVIKRRNHRKICLIDGRIAWVGSFNVSMNHFPAAQGGKGWRDTAVRLEGINVDELQHAFNSAWVDDSSLFQRKIFSAPQFRFNYIRRRRLRRDLLLRIARCHSRIWITNAYFVPDFSLLRYLKKAGRNNVDVRLLLSGSSDMFFIPWAAAAFYRKLFLSGARIFEYKERILHAKVMIVDDWMTVGSTNLDYLSFLQNFEADVVLTLPESKIAIEEQFLDDISQSREIFMHDLNKSAWWKKLLGHLLLYLKRWL